MNPDQYADDQFEQLDQYVNDVLNGNVLTNKYIYKAVERYANDLKRDDIVWEKEKVRRVLKFFSLLVVNVQNEYKQFYLMPFQTFIIANLYGFHWVATGRRRFRYSYLEMARKSGKTMFSVGLSMYHLIADGERDAQVLFLASTREQASIALRYAKSLVINSPVLESRVRKLQYYLRFTKTIDNRVSESVLKTLASNADKLDGYSPSYVLIDEYHAHTTDEIFKVMKSGVLARENPLINIITTAGFDVSKPCYQYREGAINVLRGEVIADDLFAMIFTLDEGDDFADESLWPKANPALGLISRIEDLVAEFNQAKITPSLLNNFLTKNLNMWIANNDSWIDEIVLDKAFKNDLKIEDFKGQDCYIGLDLSTTRDLTSAVLMFEKDQEFFVFPYFFMANNPQKRIRKGGINLAVWMRDGHIIECQTRTIDYELLTQYFQRWSEDFNIQALGFDNMNSALIIPQIESMGIECIRIPQTAMAFNFPLKYTEKLLYDEKMTITNPCMKWNFRNVVLYVDGNGNIKIVKNKSLDAVDGCVSLGEAMAVWLQINFSAERMAYDSYLGQTSSSSGT